jgi:hypothetical protein
MGSRRLVALKAGTRQSFRNSAHVWRTSIGQMGAREGAVTALNVWSSQ